MRAKYAKRAGKEGVKARIYSTSEARANFAAALESAHAESAVIGFGRYGRPIAALVPIEAVRLLAGQSGGVPPAVKARLVRTARLFLAEMPDAKAANGAPPARKAARGAAKNKRRPARKAVGKQG